VELDVHVIPRARRHEVAGVRNGALLVRLAAPPVEGAANAALLQFLSTRFGLPQRSIHIVAGLRTRRKRVVIAGMNRTTLIATLNR
jgi:hypothetical protein